MIMIRDFSNMFQQMSGMPVSSKGGKEMLKKHGIDTNSAQYKAAMKQMSEGARGGVGYTNPQAIKNIMANYDKDGNFKDPVTGLTGLVVNEKTMAKKNRIISIPESSREEMFELAKREFLDGDGIIDGHTTKRMDVYTNLYHKMKPEDRLAAGHTLEQYERAYMKTFTDAVKTANPDWNPGKPFDKSVLSDITRESIEKNLTKGQGKYGETLVRGSVDVSV